MHLAITGDRGVGSRVKLGLERNVRLNAIDIRIGALERFDRLRKRRFLDVAEHDFHARLREGAGNASPIPDAAPVTNAVLPAKSFIRIS